MKWRGLIAGCLALASVSASAALVDQVSAVGNASINSNSASLEWQQEVQTGIAGQLTAVELFYGSTGDKQAFRFFINRGAGWQTDADDYSAVVTPSGPSFIVDLSAAGLTFSVGEMFVIGIEGLGPNGNCCFLLGSANPGNYGPGALFLRGFEFSEGAWDLAFKTFVGGQSVPEPGALALIGISLAGLAGIRRRRR